jgi:hypothetical protein
VCLADNQDEAKRFVSVVAKERGSPVCINGLINKAAANVICSIVFGKRFEYDDEKFDNFVFGWWRKPDYPEKTAGLSQITVVSN